MIEIVQRTDHNHLYDLVGDVNGLKVHGYVGYFAKRTPEKKVEWGEYHAWVFFNGQKFYVLDRKEGNYQFTAEEIESNLKREVAHIFQG
jgi:hypothetical protein